MTDDADDRMDRARRIREMREGSRSDSAGQSGDVDADDPDAAGEHVADGDGDDDGPSAEHDSTESETEMTPDTTDEAAPSSADGPTEDSTATDTRPAAADDADGDTGMHIPGAEVGDVEVDVEEMARRAGLESTGGAADTAAEGDADADGPDESISEGPAGVEDADLSDAGAGTSATMRVLEFTLGEESYCLDIEYIEEIVKQETVTRVPNTPDHVEGVVDLRGQITTILDPKVPLDIDADGSKDLIVVFDPEEFDDQGAIGWVVDDVTQVMPLEEDEINQPPIDDEHVNGVVDRDGEFVIWTTPEIGLDEAAG